MDFPVTPAIRVLRAKQIGYTPQLYEYVEHGGTRASAKALGIPEHQIVKTLVMETERKAPLIILMHGDCEVSTKNLARLLGVKQVTPCLPEVAQKHTGYLVGGTSPFGTRKPLPVYVQQTIFELPSIAINGGKRGFLITIDPKDLSKAFELIAVDVSIDP